MKWLRAKHTYTLIVLSLLLSTGLQFVWLQQLFLAQRKQLEQELEQVVSNASQLNIFSSLVSLSGPADQRRLKRFFLSPQWRLMRQAYDNMKMSGVKSTYSIFIRGDSTAVQMNMSLKDKPGKPGTYKKPVNAVGNMTAEQVMISDSISLITMKRRVTSELKKLGINQPGYDKIFEYPFTKVQKNTLPKGQEQVFASKLYSFNLQGTQRYQLVLAEINSIVWYRMRYYLVSSVLMILLTCMAFYFILRLLRNQQLYADARADFASNMTHEFKTPIATVSVALESITKYNLANDPETLQHYLDISQHELQRLNLMVEKVLHISQDNAGEQPLNLELYEVQAGLQQVINSMKLQLQKSHAGIRLVPSAEPCFVYGDPVHLTNIFYNLIDNAIKYAGDAFEMEISCEYQGNQVILTFKDNGRGIEKIHQDKVFERFYRITGAGDTHDVKGSGLGLHYVRQMVEKHRGMIRLKSEPGKGSTFIITLPAAT
ncbi:sensor histidine kinase [Pedobacter hartonius]|nr:HAMP domain-containing sensor histidine kinase [Pedobacter hartonius]